MADALTPILAAYLLTAFVAAMLDFAREVWRAVSRKRPPSRGPFAL